MPGIFRLVSDKPLIIVCSPSAMLTMEPLLPKRPVHFWVLNPRKQTLKGLTQIEVFRRRGDKMIHFLTDRLAYEQLRSRSEFHVTWAALECMVNENQFPARPVEHKHPSKWDAGMVAQYLPLKRHNLAKDVKSLLMIASRLVVHHAEAVGYEDIIREEMQHATIVPTRKDKRQAIPRNELVKLLHQCRVALTLSPDEGVNRACYEYQLLGLPVVSTTNTGGRNQFLDPDTSMIVAPDAYSVSVAVQELIAREIPPDVVRCRVLAKLKAHRDELFRIGQQAWEADNRYEDFARHLYKLTMKDSLAIWLSDVAIRQRMKRLKHGIDYPYWNLNS